MADLNVNKTETVGMHEDVGQNLILNADFENAPSFVAGTNTANRWIDGTAAGSSSATSPFAWSVLSVSVTATAKYDTSVQHSGANSLKLDATDATGSIVAGTYITAPNAQTSLILYPSTNYVFSAWIKTNNVATNSVFIDVREYGSTFSLITTHTSTKLSGTNDWTLVSFSFTSNASALYGAILMRLNVAGNISSAWFDGISLQQTNPTNLPAVTVGPIVTPGIQDISGPKIWN